MKYYKCNKKVSSEIVEHLDARDEFKKRVLRMSRRCGASRSNFYYSSGFGRLYVTGFIFKTPPDPKEWKKLKGTQDGYAPKSTNKLRQEFGDLTNDAIIHISKILGLKNSLIFMDEGMVYITPKISTANGTVYVGIDDRWNAIPKQARRISDTTYEKIKR